MVRPLSSTQQVRLADAVCRGEVVRIECFKRTTDGHICTRTHIRVDEVFKGKFPSVVAVVHRGGTWGGRGELNGFAPQFKMGEERLLFLRRRGDGTLQALNGAASAIWLRRGESSKERSGGGAANFVATDVSLLAAVRQAAADDTLGADVTDQAGLAAAPAQSALLPAVLTGHNNATGLLVDSNGFSARFAAPDRGEPIPYLVDADVLPAGITLQQGLDAIQTAMDAWTAVTSLKFKYAGLQSFGQAAGDVDADDGYIRIQLHNTYGFVSGSDALAIGGIAFTSDVLPGADWFNGGNVAGNDFYATVSGYVVVKHTEPDVQDPVTLTEVLCHELGHVLSLAHSSVDPNELDATLRDSIMYYFVHQGGRGASLGSYDPPVIQQAYPAVNTPPYTYGRVMDIVTIPSGAPSISGINEIRLRGYDLQSSPLTIATTDATDGAGTFTLTGDRLKFTPKGYYQADRVDPADGSFYDEVAFRFSDGTNASPFVYARVISLNADAYPYNSGDGLPDIWMEQYWGNANPAAGSNRGPNDDYDGDGLTNLEEFRLGTDPTQAASALRITAFNGQTLEWIARPYELYEIYRSTDFQTWTRAGNPWLPLTTPGMATGLTDGSVGGQFLRVLKVP